MKIIYVAKHGNGGNDDEGAITFALRQLGHEVIEVPESNPKYAKLRGDFMLCHHWHDFDALRAIRIPKVFWCFDRIHEPNCPELAERNRRRMEWANAMTEMCDLGFFTDGDWVELYQTGIWSNIFSSAQPAKKFYWLMQGADERVLGCAEPLRQPRGILFMGSTKGCGERRASFVREMQERYGDQFTWVQRVHGKCLAQQIADHAVVVAPDFPCSDRYWSNRAYIALGFGAFLLHPFSNGLYDQFGADLLQPPQYVNRESLHAAIAWYNDHDLRRAYGQHGLAAVARGHTYRHRCIELINVVRERLL